MAETPIGTNRRTPMSHAPELPHVYELIVCDAVDSAVDEARRRAGAGAEEGTLVWAQEQTAARDRFGRPRSSPRGDLYGCMILRPEYPTAVALQLNYVAAISLGLAIADLVSPMTELRYRWPNAVLLNGAKAGGIVLEPGPTLAGTLEWLLLGLTANVKNHPGAAGLGVTSLQAEGADEVSAADVLEGFSRHFLSGINRWAETGFAPVRKAWSLRADGFGEIQEIRLKEETLTGKPVDLDERGALVLELADGTRRQLTVADYFGTREGPESRP